MHSYDSTGTGTPINPGPCIRLMTRKERCASASTASMSNELKRRYIRGLYLTRQSFRHICRRKPTVRLGDYSRSFTYRSSALELNGGKRHPRKKQPTRVCALHVMGKHTSIGSSPHDFCDMFSSVNSLYSLDLLCLCMLLHHLQWRFLRSIWP